MEYDHNKIIEEARKKAPLGAYEHFKKGTQYHVINHGVYCSGPQMGATVIYHERDNPDQIWCRRLDDFCSTVTDANGNFVPRFKLYQKHNSLREVLLNSVASCKKMYQENCVEEPGYHVSGAGKSLKYIAGDKVSFAMSCGIIPFAEASKLIDEINGWEPYTEEEVNALHGERGVPDQRK